MTHKAIIWFENKSKKAEATILAELKKRKAILITKGLYYAESKDGESFPEFVSVFHDNSYHNGRYIAVPIKKHTLWWDMNEGIVKKLEAYRRAKPTPRPRSVPAPLAPIA